MSFYVIRLFDFGYCLIDSFAVSGLILYSFIFQTQFLELPYVTFVNKYEKEYFQPVEQTKKEEREIKHKGEWQRMETGVKDNVQMCVWRWTG